MKDEEKSVSSFPGALLPNEIAVMLRVNGTEYALQIEPRVTLLDALREYIGLTGTKKGCNHGQCGACTVLIDGRRINSCLAIAAVYEDREITTIEGIGDGDELHPVQAAFIKRDAFQCGYCTPGQICSAVAMLTEVAAGVPSTVTANVAAMEQVELSDEEISERMSGNLCRCCAYPNIVDAIREVIDEEAGSLIADTIRKVANKEARLPITVK